jgi:hypothetical protein
MCFFFIYAQASSYDAHVDMCECSETRAKQSEAPATACIYIHHYIYVTLSYTMHHYQSIHCNLWITGLGYTQI